MVDDGVFEEGALGFQAAEDSHYIVIGKSAVFVCFCRSDDAGRVVSILCETG